MARYYESLDANGTWETRQRHAVIDVTPTPELVATKGNPLAIPRSESRDLKALGLDSLAQVLSDLKRARELLRSPNVGYVLVDDIGSVNRNNIATRTRQVERELSERRRQFGGTYEMSNDIDDVVTTLQKKDEFLQRLLPDEEEEPVNNEHLNAEFYRRQAAMHLATAEKLDGMPLVDPFEEGQVISFQKNFGGSRPFSYAAIKVENGWYITGGQQSNTLFSWTTLLDFIGIEGFDTIAVMETRPELGIRQWWASKQKAKELEGTVEVK